MFEAPVVILLIVCVVALAAPKWRTPNASARVAALRADLQNARAAEEAYYADTRSYATIDQLQARNAFELSPGNSMSAVVDAKGYTLTVSNPATGARITRCSLQLGARVDDSVAVPETIICM